MTQIGFKPRVCFTTVSAEPVWKSMSLCWICVYLGAPDIIKEEEGNQFMDSVFQTNDELLNIKTKTVPLESHN